MKSFVTLSALFALVTSASVTMENADIKTHSVYGYLTKVSVPDKIRSAEVQSAKVNKIENVNITMKIIDGHVARLGDFPYQAGLIIDLQNKQGQRVCGGTLLNSRRVLTAAHCWYDGNIHGTRVTVVLGSLKLFSGGTRIQTSQVVVHKQWQPMSLVNDIAMIYLPYHVKFSETIQPIALPSGNELLWSYVGNAVVASGFGSTRDGELASKNTYLSYVPLRVITNAECAKMYGVSVRPSTICTVGDNIKNTCRGDSGGPVALFGNNRRILLGVNSFGAQSCETGHPTGYTRVTYYINWIKSQL